MYIGTPPACMFPDNTCDIIVQALVFLISNNNNCTVNK